MMAVSLHFNYYMLESFHNIHLNIETNVSGPQRVYQSSGHCVVEGGTSWSGVQAKWSLCG
jgi:hypothetical protein